MKILGLTWKTSLRFVVESARPFLWYDSFVQWGVVVFVSGTCGQYGQVALPRECVVLDTPKRLSSLFLYIGCSIYQQSLCLSPIVTRFRCFRACESEAVCGSEELLTANMKIKWEAEPILGLTCNCSICFEDQKHQMKNENKILPSTSSSRSHGRHTKPAMFNATLYQRN